MEYRNFFCYGKGMGVICKVFGLYITGFGLVDVHSVPYFCCISVGFPRRLIHSPTVCRFLLISGDVALLLGKGFRSTGGPAGARGMTT